MEKNDNRLYARIRDELAARVHEKARYLQQNPNHLVNVMVEGCLAAMDGESDNYKVPVVELFRRASGKTKNSTVSRVMQAVADLSTDLTWKVKPNKPTMSQLREKTFSLAVSLLSERVENEGSLTESALLEHTWRAYYAAMEMLGIRQYSKETVEQKIKKIKSASAS